MSAATLCDGTSFIPTGCECGVSVLVLLFCIWLLSFNEVQFAETVWGMAAAGSLAYTWNHDPYTYRTEGPPGDPENIFNQVSPARVPHLCLTSTLLPQQSNLGYRAAAQSPTMLSCSADGTNLHWLCQHSL